MQVKKRFQKLTVVLATLLIVSLSFCVFSNELHDGKKVAKKDVPAAVISAFEKSYPNTPIKRVEKSTKDSVICYEIETKNGKSEQSITYNADGSIIEIKADVAVSSLPAEVTNAITAKYPQGKVNESEKTIQGATVQYEVSVRVGKEETELTIDDKGNMLLVKPDKGEKEDKSEGEDKGENEKKGDKEEIE